MFKLNERERMACLAGVSKTVCLGAALALIVLMAGCSKRQMAPEVSYDEVQVERIQTEVEKLEW